MSMSPQSWGRVKEVLDAVLDAEPAERPELIDRLCGDDAAVRVRVERYLDHEEAAEDFLEEPAYRTRRDTLEVGEQVGPYEIVERLGRGGMGAVYTARRRDDFDQRVALKVVRRGLDTDDILRRFHNERQLLARLEHPSIARLLDGGSTADGRPFFAMEQVDGEPIDVWCDERRLGVRQRIELFLDVCEAVRAAHRRLIVHRDLKPSNILVDEQGRPKLLDFGIAKLLHDDSDLMTVRTRRGQRPLTLRWASPEQVAGEPVTTASDVYSLGLLLFELLTGRYPYRLTTGSDEEMTRSILDDEPTRPSAAVALPVDTRANKASLGDEAGSEQTATRPTDPESRALCRGVDPERLRRLLRGDLDAIVLKALRKEPAERYGSVDELVADLTRHLEGRPITARPPTWRYRTGRFLRRNAVAVSIGVLIAALLIGWALSVTLQSRTIQRESDRAAAASEFLEGLFLSVDPDERQGEELSALDVLDLGHAQLLGDEYAERPRLRADLALTLARVYEHLGETEAAIELFRLARTERRKVFDEDHAEVVRSEHFLASTLAGVDRYDEAEELMTRLVEVARLTSDPEVRRQLPDLLHSYGWLLHLRGRSAAAEPPLREALALKLAVLDPDDRSVLSTRRNLARVLRALGRADEARRETRAVLEARLASPHATASDITTSWSDVAMEAFADGELQEAEEAFREALARRLELYGDQHFLVARTRNNLARVLQRQGRLQEAEDLVRAAYAVYRQTDRTGFTGVMAKNLAVLAAEQDRCDESLELLAEARPLLEQLEIRTAPAHRADARSVEGWCRWVMAADDPAARQRAVETMRQAVAELEEIGSTGSIAAEARLRLERALEAERGVTRG
ncbi:MAG: serine/threonine-protein kinase [Acidobacteriota bacterium]